MPRLQRGTGALKERICRCKTSKFTNAIKPDVARTVPDRRRSGRRLGLLDHAHGRAGCLRFPCQCVVVQSLVTGAQPSPGQLDRFAVTLSFCCCCFSPLPSLSSPPPLPQTSFLPNCPGNVTLLIGMRFYAHIDKENM